MGPLKSILLALVTAPVIVACGGGGDSSEGNAIGASANLGVLTNATVNFYENDNETLLGTGDTGDDGVVTLDIRDYEGPVVVEIVGDDDAMYFDESALTVFPFGPSMRMYAVMPGPSEGPVAVTPLTDVAYRRALAQGLFPIMSSEVEDLNEIVRASLAPGLMSILSVPTPFDENITSGSLMNDEAGRYAVVLAGLARLGAGFSPSPGLAVQNALQVDVLDGVIDGQNGSEAITPTPPYNDFLNALQTEINAAAADYGNPELQANSDNLGPSDIDLEDDEQGDDSDGGGSDDDGSEGGGSGDGSDNGDGSGNEDGSGDGSDNEDGSDDDSGNGNPDDGDDTNPPTGGTGGTGGSGGTGTVGTGGGGF